MTLYQNMIQELRKIFQNDELTYESSIIIGDNSSGKSDVIKGIIEDGITENVYYLDSVNRYFSEDQIMTLNPSERIEYSNDIVGNRIKEDNFKDTFFYKGAPRAIEDFYLQYENEVRVLMQDFLQAKFEIKRNEVEWQIIVDDEVVKLSSGYQALLRIFLEITYFASFHEQGIIVIDEIDEFLSAKNAGKILNYLRKNFPKQRFIVTTHSPDLIANVQEANLIVLYHTKYEILDAGDYASISQVYNLFKKTFLMNEGFSLKDRIDEDLRILLNNKMSGIWKQQEEELLQKLEKENLTNAQKLLFRQIKEW